MTTIMKFDWSSKEPDAIHAVRLRRPQPLREIIQWWIDNGAGHYAIEESEADDSPNIIAMRFTDKNAAFWFKMRFG